MQLLPIRTSIFVTSHNFVHNNSFKNNYEIIKKINNGAQGTIMLGYDKKAENKVAIKILNENNKSNEIYILKYISKNYQNNLLKIYNHYNINKKTFIVIEFIDGLDLCDYINSVDVSIDRVLNIALELCLALNHLKKNKIIHCDLKPENIMIDKNDKPIIVDFGSAIINNKIKNKPFSYTYCYQPPEFFKYNIVSYSSDLWALGCIFYSLITKQHPFLLTNKNENVVINNILNVSVSFIQPIWKNVPLELELLIQNMLSKNSIDRYSIETIISKLQKIKLEPIN
jgi:serine/threonine-protein kinase